MKILVLADQESKSLYEFFTPDKIKDIDLIISCGDLRAEYLSFFATFSELRYIMSVGIMIAGICSALRRAVSALRMIS